MSNPVWPHRWQPTRLPHPWDSPGKNTGVGCHFLLQCMKVKSESEVASHVRLLVTPWTAAYQAPPSMGFSRQKSTGVGCHWLLRSSSYLLLNSIPSFQNFPSWLCSLWCCLPLPSQHSPICSLSPNTLIFSQNLAFSHLLLFLKEF